MSDNKAPKYPTLTEISEALLEVKDVLNGITSTLNEDRSDCSTCGLSVQKNRDEYQWARALRGIELKLGSIAGSMRSKARGP